MSLTTKGTFQQDTSWNSSFNYLNLENFKQSSLTCIHFSIFNENLGLRNFSHTTTIFITFNSLKQFSSNCLNYRLKSSQYEAFWNYLLIPKKWTVIYGACSSATFFSRHSQPLITFLHLEKIECVECFSDKIRTPYNFSLRESR